MGTSSSGDAAAKRARILEAALEVCGRRGVAAARMDEVAERAGVSKGTLYRFFQSKEDLFLATLLASYEEGLGIVDAGLAPIRDPRARLEAYFDGLGKVLATVGPRMDVHYQAWGVVANDRELAERLYGFLRDFHTSRDDEIEAIIRDGQRTGAFRTDVDAVALAAGVSMLLNGFLYRATFHPGAATPDALRACFDAMVRSVLVDRGGGGGERRA